MTRIAILNYGMGNLRSVEKALERVGCEAEITADAERVQAADGVILPGVGAFPKAMENIRELGLDVVIHERAAAGVPVLGICLGLQLLFSRSVELGGAVGLGLIEGEVSEIEAGARKIPHIGWAEVQWQKPSRLTDGLAEGEPFYFVHSFTPRPGSPGDALGAAAYGETFCCAAERDNVFGVQFHPEKSSAAGLRLLSNFAEICAQTSRLNNAGPSPSAQSPA